MVGWNNANINTHHSKLTQELHLIWLHLILLALTRIRSNTLAPSFPSLLKLIYGCPFLLPLESTALHDYLPTSKCSSLAHSGYNYLFYLSTLKFLDTLNNLIPSVLCSSGLDLTCSSLALLQWVNSKESPAVFISQLKWVKFHLNGKEVSFCATSFTTHTQKMLALRLLLSLSTIVSPALWINMLCSSMWFMFLGLVSENWKDEDKILKFIFCPLSSSSNPMNLTFSFWVNWLLQVVFSLPQGGTKT